MDIALLAEKCNNVRQTALENFPFHSAERFLQISKICRHVYETKSRGINTIVTLSNMPTRLLIKMSTQDIFTTDHLAQNTLGILLPHKGSLPEKVITNSKSKGWVDQCTERQLVYHFGGHSVVVV